MDLPPAFAALLDTAGLPLPVPEFRFAPPRKWRFDYCWPAQRLALEVDGGAWLAGGGGRHNRARGFLADMVKLNRAACLGYRVLRCTPRQFAAGALVLDLIAEALRVDDAR